MKAAPVVYVHGDEPYLVDRALREIEQEALPGGASDFNREVFEAPEAQTSSVLSAARTLPFLGGRRFVLVKGAHAWPAEAWERLIPYLEAPNPSTCLVFVAERLDRRTRAGKILEKAARVVECPRPAERELLPWASRMAEEEGLRLPTRVLQSLVLRVGPDLQMLWQEVQKLRAFAGEGGDVAEEDLEALVGVSRGTTVFVLCNALGQRELASAVQTLRQLLEMGEPPVRVLFMVVRHFRSLWVARELLDRGGRIDARAAAPKLGVPPFVAETILRQAKGWEEEELKSAFRAFLKADLSLKTGGRAEVMDGLVLRLCGSADRSRHQATREAKESRYRPKGR